MFVVVLMAVTTQPLRVFVQVVVRVRSQTQLLLCAVLLYNKDNVQQFFVWVVILLLHSRFFGCE